VYMKDTAYCLQRRGLRQKRPTALKLSFPQDKAVIYKREYIIGKLQCYDDCNIYEILQINNIFDCISLSSKQFTLMPQDDSQDRNMWHC
jgi:hypothetical protein